MMMIPATGSAKAPLQHGRGACARGTAVGALVAAGAVGMAGMPSTEMSSHTMGERLPFASRNWALTYRPIKLRPIVTVKVLVDAKGSHTTDDMSFTQLPP